MIERFGINMNLSRFIHLPASLPANFRSNYVNYLFDIGWWGLYSGTIVPFLSVYAVRSGATNEQVGLLTAAPALAALLLSLPFGRWIQRYSARRSTAIGAFIQRLLFFTYALIPAIITPGAQVTAILVTAITIAIPGTVVGITFNQLFMEAVPSDWRAYVVGARNALFSILTFLFTLLSAEILTRAAFPGGYQIIFAIGAAGGLMTSFHLNRVRPVPECSPVLPEPEKSLQKSRSFFFPLDQAGRRYLKVALILFLFNATNAMFTPLVPIFSVNALKLADQMIGIGTALNTFLTFCVSLVIARLIRRTGNQRSTAIGAALFCASAVVLAFATDVTLYLVAMIIGGVANGVLITAQFNYNIENIPATHRYTWLSWNVLFGNAAVLLGSMAGPVLSTAVNVPIVLAGIGALRLVSSLLIFRWG